MSLTKRKVVAIGGIDAHAHKHNVMGFEFEIFGYKILFKSIRTHVLVEKEFRKGHQKSYETDRDQVIEALGKGRSFIVNNYYGKGNGFRFLQNITVRIILWVMKSYQINLKAKDHTQNHAAFRSSD